MSYKVNLQRLEKDIRDNKQVVLFLGAGINSSEGINLSWKDIITPLMESALLRFAATKGLSEQEIKDVLDVFDVRDEPSLIKNDSYHKIKADAIFDYSPQIKAMLIKYLLKDQYIAAFQDRIYSQCNRTEIRRIFDECYNLSAGEKFKQTGKLYTLYTISRMILLNPNVRAVVTYNYDNFLTHAITHLQNNPDRYFCPKEAGVIKERIRKFPAHRLNVRDIYGESRPDILDNGTLFVYHPHGYIPSPDESDNLNKSQIIMSVDEYCENTVNAYSWDNDTQVHLLSHYTCIFVGSSISDLTTQRMLHYAKRNGNNDFIYFLGATDKKDKCEYPENLLVLKENLSHLKNMYFNLCGLVDVVCPDGFNALFNDINNVTSKYVETKIAK